MCLFCPAYHKLPDLTAPIIVVWVYDVQDDKGPYRSAFSISLVISFPLIQEDM